jgi:metal-responsive CopG/Arc/MetJ family transcriptional regulator
VIRGARRKVKPESGDEAPIRATISFPGKLYRTLEQIASQKKVSLAWVVREATEQYVENKWPLFKREI